jgi:predicted hotdog family 3-hydroxylacyl-ACP dehydratase
VLNSRTRDHAWIAAHIPHQGNMCLLHSVLGWDDFTLQCNATSHRAADNPLRAHGQLGAVCGIEYALLAPADTHCARIGYLVSIRGTRLHTARLDDIADDLLVEVSCITANENNILYEFSVSAGGQLLLDGRAAVVLDAALLSPGVPS